MDQRSHNQEEDFDDNPENHDIKKRTAGNFLIRKSLTNQDEKIKVWILIPIQLHSEEIIEFEKDIENIPSYWTIEEVDDLLSLLESICNKHLNMNY